MAQRIAEFCAAAVAGEGRFELTAPDCLVATAAIMVFKLASMLFEQAFQFGSSHLGTLSTQHNCRIPQKCYTEKGQRQLGVTSIFDVRAKKFNPASEGIAASLTEPAKKGGKRHAAPAHRVPSQPGIQPENCLTIQSTTRRVAGSSFKCGWISRKASRRVFNGVAVSRLSCSKSADRCCGSTPTPA